MKLSALNMSFSAGEQHARVHSRKSAGFLERVSDSTGGVIAGVCLFTLSVYLLFTNEGRAVRTSLSLDEGLSQVVLHLLQYFTPLHFVVLCCRVELYAPLSLWMRVSQVVDFEKDGETKTETTYTYNTEWKSEVINSRHFDEEVGHMNPSAMAVESVTVVAPDVWVGKLFLSSGLMEQINDFHTLSLKGFPAFDANTFLTVYEDYFYHTANPRRPEVGDVRVCFAYAGLSGDGMYPGSAHKVSVVAMQRGDQLKPFKTRAGDTLEILYMDELSAEGVFAKEQQVNVMKTWGLRVAGWVLMFLAVSLSTRIIYTLVDWVPVLRELVSVGLKLFALCVSSSLSLLTIAAGWMFYRPLMAGLIAVLALLPVLITRARAPAKKSQ
ncbi:putative transmembrane protein 43-like [Triplophysa rosa]|uniref:Transmembrane protein 43-like n=1 Tax=Triplophysa rosa TaxID=992332 RepID=A0A9W7W8H8_TRIRA|nr:putative transmembrane protein 43-like [Triplophysa rosa]